MSKVYPDEEQAGTLPEAGVLPEAGMYASPAPDRPDTTSRGLPTKEEQVFRIGSTTAGAALISGAAASALGGPVAMAGVIGGLIGLGVSGYAAHAQGSSRKGNDAGQ